MLFCFSFCFVTNCTFCILFVLAINPCANNLCRNNAQCVADAREVFGYRCICRPGFQGTFCESQICTSNKLLYFLENKLMRLYSNPASSYAPIFQYAPIFKQLLFPCHLSQAEKVISPELFGPQKWFTYQNVGNFICYRYMRLFSNSNEVQAPYAPIFDGRLLLGMSLFSKKYSTILIKGMQHNNVCVRRGDDRLQLVQFYLS